ncbi:hypothetical protein ANN_18954 [Periplaneta americana]|uniref:Uncharacterized protein n=1 Tax=Periplaneta americana TaxID=6978 RepID=A0ABQ8SQX2_PERAM|nr:hypothetical protein ANN_18954 [Periplaneta americana]
MAGLCEGGNESASSLKAISECERSFSSINEIVTPIRNVPLVEHIADLMFINLTESPLSESDPLSCEILAVNWEAISRRNPLW